MPAKPQPWRGGGRQEEGRWGPGRCRTVVGAEDSSLRQAPEVREEEEMWWEEDKDAGSPRGWSKPWKLQQLWKRGLW